MTISGESHQKIDAYLKRVRKALRGMPSDDADEIIAELHSHILDRAAAGGGEAAAAGRGEAPVDGGEAPVAGVDAAIHGLGSPESLASQYATEALMIRAQVSRSPVVLMQSLFRWAGLSAAGFFVCLGALVGYVLAAVLLLCALVKPFRPHTAGLWTSNGADGLNLGFHLGFGASTPQGKEILGWWIIPIGLALGYGLFVWTTRCALWSVRQYRNSRELRRS